MDSLSLKGHVLFACIVLLALPSIVTAGVLEQNASLFLSTEYDDNPALSANNKQSVWRYIAVPSYNLALVDETSRLYLDALIRYQRSSNTDLSVNRQDPTIGIGWQKEFERRSFSLSAQLNQSSTRITEIVNGTGVVSKDSTNREKTVNASWTENFTPRLSLTSGVNWQKSEFGGGSGLSNFTSYGANFQLGYFLTEKVRPFVQFSTSKYRPENNLSSDSTSRNYTAGATWLIDPKFSITAFAGVNQTSVAGNGWVADAKLNYELDRHHFNADYARSVNASGIGNFQKSDRYNFTYNYDLSDKSGLESGYSLTKNSGNNANESQQVTLGYRRDLTQDWNLRLLMQYRDIKSSGASASGNLLGFSITYQVPQF